MGSCWPQTLPRPVRFVAKAELRDHLLARWFLDGIGTLYVDRFDVARSVAHAGGLSGGSSRRGRNPRLRGRNPASNAGTAALPDRGVHGCGERRQAPAVPVVLRGTRSLMRNGTWFPRRVPIHVRIGPPSTAPAPGLPPARWRARPGAERLVAGHRAPRYGPGVDARPLRRARPRQPEPPPRPHRAPHRLRDLNPRSCRCFLLRGQSVVTMK